jgi:hypothetical protein
MIGPLNLGALKALAIAGLVTLLTVGGWGVVATFKASRATAAAATSQAELQAIKAEVATQATQASKTRTEAQRLASRANTKVSDELQKTRSALGAERAAVEQRLRERATQYAADAAASATGQPAGARCADDAPPLARLSEQTRSDLVSLAADAQADAADLAAAQRYIAEVVPLCQPPAEPAR